MNLAVIRIGIVGAIAISAAPKVQKMSAVMISGFLPHLSDAVPEKRDPNAAPNSARLTMSDL